MLAEDLPVHDWYRFVLSFPPHLVRRYLERFAITGDHLVLDPFAGTGTTLVECKKSGIPCIGIEAHPMSHFASRVKTDWRCEPAELVEAGELVYQKAWQQLDKEMICDVPDFFDTPRHNHLRTLPTEQMRLLLKNSISPLPLHKALVLRDNILEMPEPVAQYHKLAFAKALVQSASNLHFGPEVGVRKIKNDAAVLMPWLDNVKAIASDLAESKDYADIPSTMILGDSRSPQQEIEPASVDFVFTSPPYPNEKDYTRTTRLESVLLGCFSDMAGLRSHKKRLLRSNTRNVYKADDDDKHVLLHDEIQDIARRIERRRIELGKTSGFEKLYARVTRLYFGGMASHFEWLRTILRPGAILAYVVGDQASYLRIMIRTGRLLGEIAEALGYEVLDLDIFRTRMATATKEHLNEEVLLLRWNG